MTWGKVSDRLHAHSKARRARLESAGIACRALRWPMSEGKGLDDLLSRHRDGFERAIEWTERREAH